ncbi:hypothetical protein JTE90_019979 [Oedothorax gibbosus]|uniref:Elongation of very long chain fatty acids protein n=1 Tax=Oedothorax gibbosus TaxID=931172 RepID=A0AAV6TNR2_9ARAC|nr:hypothetical protein JTE90_019979 [Oedothorax gibbosus]
MKNRKAFELKNLLIFYNFFQMMANSYITIVTVITVVTYWDQRCVHDITGHLAAGVLGRKLHTWHLYLIKFIDLLDAVFFVLRKKDKQITFLHVFHHVAVCWVYYRYIETLDMEEKHFISKYLKESL